MTAYDQLLAHTRDTMALVQVSGRLGWDKQPVMPGGASAQRAAEQAAMAKVLHARRTDPQIGDWLENAVAPDDVGAAQLRHIRRSFERANKVPADLAAELASQTSLSQRVWTNARKKLFFHQRW